MKTPKSFVNSLAEIKLPGVFNPYIDHCVKCDLGNSPAIRRGNLLRCLETALDLHADTIWIARDLGYRGGRRTGIPLTDEPHLDSMSSLLGNIKLERATHGQVVTERTATVIWKMLLTVDRPIVLWNIFPFHPYELGNQFSNRCHTKAEREITWKYLGALIEMIKPKKIVAIGKDAGSALSEINISLHTVRHPSYGGQNEFIAGILDIYKISADAAEEKAKRLPIFAAHRDVAAFA